MTEQTPIMVQSLFLGAAKEVPVSGTDAWWDKPWRTGYFKEPQTARCWLGYQGFRGDEQADRAHHGGVDKAVCVYSQEHYPDWRRELAMPELPYGAFGENITVNGLTEERVFIGDVFSLGEAVVQVSQPRQPCWKLARRWQVKDLPARAEQSGRTGFYFRVLQHGWVAPGAEMRLIEHREERWSVAAANQVMHHAKDDVEAARTLSECRALSASWKDQLWQRVCGKEASTDQRLLGG